MLGGVKGFVSMASSRRPSRRSARRIAPPLRPFSRVRVARPSVHSLSLRSVWPGRLCPPFRFNFPFRVPPRVFDPGRFPVYPPTDLLQVCRTVACVHGTRSALAAGQVLTAAARSSAPPSPPTPRALPRRPSQHPAHRCPRLRPPHCIDKRLIKFGSVLDGSLSLSLARALSLCTLCARALSHALLVGMVHAWVRHSVLNCNVFKTKCRDPSFGLARMGDRPPSRGSY